MVCVTSLTNREFLIKSLHIQENTDIVTIFSLLQPAAMSALTSGNNEKYSFYCTAPQTALHYYKSSHTVRGMARLPSPEKKQYLQRAADIQLS